MVVLLQCEGFHTLLPLIFFLAFCGQSMEGLRILNSLFNVLYVKASTLPPGACYNNYHHHISYKTSTAEHDVRQWLPEFQIGRLDVSLSARIQDLFEKKIKNRAYQWLFVSASVYFMQYYITKKYSNNYSLKNSSVYFCYGSAYFYKANKSSGLSCRILCHICLVNHKIIGKQGDVTWAKDIHHSP